VAANAQFVLRSPETPENYFIFSDRSIPELEWFGQSITVVKQPSR
jgi:hypothetical protein